MSTIEKLFVQIFDRKRQIIQQLNHQKQLYDQNLASKLLIQGITPPPWLLNSDKFASYYASSSDPTDLNKEELISGLLLPFPQPVPSYCNATHLYSQPLSTVGNGDLQHDLFNATDPGGKGLDNCRPGHSPQCLIKGLEDVQQRVAESPQERVASDTYTDLDQSLARMQRSKSRQKALELRSSRKLSAKCQLEGNPSTVPRRQDASNEQCATTSGEALSTSRDICLLKKQDETDAPSNMISPPRHCRDMSVDLLREPIVGSDESKCANADLFKDELIDSQSVFREEDKCTSKSKSDDAQSTGDAERLVAIELPENIIDQLRRPASLCGPPSYFHESHDSDRKRNVNHSAPVGVFKKTNLRDTSVLSGISRAIVADAPTNLLSPHSDCRDFSLEESIAAAVSVSSKRGISAPVRVLEQTKIGDTPAQSDIEKDAPTNLMSPNGLCRELYVEESLVAEDSVSSKGGISRNLHKESIDDRKCSNSNLLTDDLRESRGLSKEEDISLCHTKELEASSDLLSPEKHIEIDAPTNLMSLVAEDSVSSKGGVSRHLRKESVDIDEFCDRKCANSNLLTEDIWENHGLSNEEDISLCHAKEPEASSDLLSPEKHIAQSEFQSNSPSSETVNRVTNSKVLEETAADGALFDKLLHMDKGEGLKLSPQELTSELDLENQCDLSSGKDSRESQRRYGASVDQCETVEWSGETVNELASSSSEDNRKHASLESPKEDTCCSKEDKISISPKLIELQTLGTESSPTSSVGGSWPKKKRRKFKSITSRSASPHLRVNSSSISSSGVYVANSSTGDFSATEIFQNDTSSMRQHKEEKHSSQASTDVDPEELQVHSVSCLTQQLTATPQDSLHRDDQSTEKCDFPFSISKVDGDPTDSKIWQGGNSLEAHNIHNCLNEEAVGAEGQRPDFECFTFDKKLQNPHGEIDADVSDILLSSSTASPLENRDTVGRKTSMADLVNFTFYSECKNTDDTGDPEKLVAIGLPKNAIDRAEFLERLCRSASLGVSFSDLHASYSSDVKEGVCHSVPARVFDQKDSRYTSTVSDSSSHTYTGNVENSEFQGNLFSDHSPTNGTPFAWYCKGPYTSPFEKSRSSSHYCSSNPELTCFPIEESGEEDVSADESDHVCPEETASEEYMNDVALDPVSEIVNLGSVSTETSPDITCIPEEEEISKQHVDVIAPQACQETIASARKPLCDISKRETESFSRQSKRSEVNRKISQNSEAQPYQSGRLRKRKVTQNTSFGTTGKKKFESRPTRFSKSKASLKSGLETRGGSLSVKEAKPSNNIVSSIKSFLPLVQQKQAASCAPVKKEVRVKALEAAEAARRLAEKKENERNQKKEALKLERARIEQEKVRQLGLVKKAKEEEKKRKEAEIAERKRKREEEEQEERKEKENKRKRIGEARKQKKGQQESKLQTEDAKTDRRREDDSGTQEMVAGGLQKNLVNSKEQKDFPANVAGCSTPTPDITTQTVREKSYDISPYCCSDEEDEEDDLPNNKFIPAWASKSSIKTALASLDNLDPEVIFPPSTFCSLNEVLLPRELKQR